MLSSQVKFSADRQTDRQADTRTDRQTPAKQYAVDLSMQGHKNSELSKLQAFADDKLYVVKVIISVFDRVKEKD